MERFHRILVTTDTRRENQGIVHEAAEIARLNHASLKIVDVVPDFPWTVRLTLKDHQHHQDLMCEEKKVQLEQIAASLDSSGIDVETAVLRGSTSIEVIREVLRGQHDLVMRVIKGQASRASSFIGTTGMRLLRKCPCPVWLVTPQADPKFEHVMGCVDTSSGEALDEGVNSQVFQLAKSVSRYHQGRLSIVHAWSIWNELMLKSRMSDEEFQRLEKNSLEQVSVMLDQFLQRHGTSVSDEHVHLIKGEPSQVIPRLAAERKVDLIVMGTVGRSGLSGMIMGNTAERILGQIQCSVLAVKPAGFVCPITI